MKKVLILGAVVVLSLTALIGCGGEEFDEEEFDEGTAIVDIQ
ncbi:hypothetical protein [Natranaerobius trueperi]|nr:hypothetical protein [Natranaerobius trueperi]